MPNIWRGQEFCEWLHTGCEIQLGPGYLTHLGGVKTCDSLPESQYAIITVGCNSFWQVKAAQLHKINVSNEWQTGQCVIFSWHNRLALAVSYSEMLNAVSIHMRHMGLFEAYQLIL